MPEWPWWSYAYSYGNCFDDKLVRDFDGNQVLSLSSEYWASLAGLSNDPNLELLDYAVEADVYIMLRESCNVGTTRGAGLYLRSTYNTPPHLRGGYRIWFEPYPKNKVSVTVGVDPPPDISPIIGEITFDPNEYKLEVDKWYRIKASVTGVEYGEIVIKAYIDDELVLTVIDDGTHWNPNQPQHNGYTSGYSALSGGYARNYYDNVRIYQVTPEVTDADGDGYSSDLDCDDSNAAINPGATEECNSIDDNCNGAIDEGVKSTFYLDSDGDNYGNPSATTEACTAPTGYVGNSTDCNDGNNSIYPGAAEIAYDDIDQDCSGADLTDVDGDGFDSTAVVGGTDCDDNDNNTYPGAAEIAYDGIDQDCNGADLTDVDGDGFDSSVVAGGTDCNDNDNTIYPGATETPYDGVDQDCTGSDLTDVDGDGYDALGAGGDDCNDEAVSIHPNATEIPYDNIDQDCSGADLTDFDGDGYDALSVGGDDCNDELPSIHPGAPEDCNGLDDNCNGEADEGVLITFYADSDSDGFGDAGAIVEACSAPPSYVENSSDCDDSNSAVKPGASEVCNGIDDDCNADTEDGSQEAWLGATCDGGDTDFCQEGIYSCTSGVQTCSDITGDDIEVCDGQDNDCDGSVDEGYDADSDGVAYCFDNCYEDANPNQSDIDGDGAGDVCDVCPADELNECNQDGSTAEEIPADQGGTVETPDGELTIDIDSGDLNSDTTISVTQTNHQDEDVDLLIGPSEGLGRAVAVYDLKPEGQSFNAPVSITVEADVTHLNANQREKLGLYQWNETEVKFEPVPDAICNIVENPVGTFIKTCTAQLTHFSLYAMVAPLDSDDDGVPDLFGDEQDLCPTLPADVSMSMDYTSDLVLPVGETGFATANAEVVLKDNDGETLPSVPVSMTCTDGDELPYGQCEMSTNEFGIVSCNIENLTPGVYTLDVVSNKLGCPEASIEALLAVYDPDGGFVTGGGWIYSPEGAYIAALNLEGKANFGFVSKYKKGATEPTGNTEFQFKAGDLNFHSDTYEWLVVNQYGTNAQFKGSGTINGEGYYKFMLWAGDGDPDTFRIRIWTEDEATGVETDVYDNGSEQAIGGGSIVVHTKDK
jgi:hypothetical protein